MDGFGPLDSFLFQGSDPVRVELGIRRATAEHVTACMRSLGWDDVADPIDEAQVRQDVITQARGSELSDDEFREAWGYGSTRSLLDPSIPAEGTTPGAVYYASLSPAEQDTYGQQKVTCSGQANREIGLDDDRWQEFGRLQDEMLPQITADADREAQEDLWSRCMSDHGFTVSSIQTATEGFERESRVLYDSPSPDLAVAEDLRRREVAQADVDWECRRTTVVAAWIRARDAVESRFVEDHVELLTAIRESLTKAAGRP